MTDSNTSIQELTARLVQIKEDLSARDKLRKNMERVRAGIEEERARFRGLAETLRKESRDVKRLEGLSLHGLFYEILGSKEEQLEKERQEELAARLKRDQSSHALAALENEYSELGRRTGELERLDAQYESVLEEKERLLTEKDTDHARKLIALAESAGALQASQKELAEAIAAGEAVRHSLRGVFLRQPDHRLGCERAHRRIPRERDLGAGEGGSNHGAAA